MKIDIYYFVIFSNTFKNSNILKSKIKEKNEKKINKFLNFFKSFSNNKNLKKMFNRIHFSLQTYSIHKYIQKKYNIKIKKLIKYLKKIIKKKYTSYFFYNYSYLKKIKRYLLNLNHVLIFRFPKLLELNEIFNIVMAL
uniref:Uncharacterized protein n=1 Tax=Lotharella vacuolata TaxID=74820 RepID=A0A0H5BH26_9EUKA|nr:hypothetical protein [Lotharella vacuolata]